MLTYRHGRELDPVGETVALAPEYSPRMAPKTASGFLFSLVFQCLFVLIVAYYIYQLVADGNTSLEATDEVWVGWSRNGAIFNEWWKRYMTDEHQPRLDVPTFLVQIKSAVSLYSADEPSLQKIEVIDSTG